MKHLATIITVLLALVFFSDSFAYDQKCPVATGESYFDAATGHRYIKNPDATYKEYTKKGELFRASIPADLPLLTTNKYMCEVGRGCFMIYEKQDQHILKRQILPVSSRHPKGWRAKTVIACLDSFADEKSNNEIGLGYTSSEALAFNGKQRFATAESYFDVFTGHRYIKNLDATYREYTRRGDLFRVSVPPHMPLLTTNRHIREIGQNCYLLYKRNKNQEIETLVLPSEHKHPIGWMVEDMLLSIIY